MICPNCGGSSFVKHGFVQEEGVQRWKCTRCGRNVTEKTFSVTYRHRHTTHQIRATVALMMLTNVSTRTAKTLLELFTGTTISNVTAWEWSAKFRDKLEITSRQFRKVQAGMIWHVDEMFIKVRGSTSKKDCSYLVIVRDQHGTILGVAVGHQRNDVLISKAIRQARSRAKKKPAVIVSDGWKSYPNAIESTFSKEKKRDSPKHVVAHFKARRVQHKCRRYKLSNNPIERTNSFFREWSHGKRGFKSVETAQRIIEAWAAVHNIRRHAGIEFWLKAFP